MQGDSGPKKKRRWTVLFVDEQGETRTLPRFKGMVTMVVFLLLMLTAWSAVSYYLYRNARNRNDRILAANHRYREQLTTLQNENELLTARVVLLRSRLNDGAPTAPGDEETEAVEENIASDTSAEEDSGPLPAADAENDTDTPGDVTVPVVDVEDLVVSHDALNEAIWVTFILRKTDESEGPVSGRTFVILKGDQMDSSRWLTFPNVDFSGGKPTRIRNGRYFSISRFNYVKFKAPYNDNPQRFRHATVLVYALDGRLLLEKHFDIRIQAHVADEDN